MYLFNLYHQATKLITSSAPDTPPVSKWPKEWTTTHIKSYPRFTQITLPDPKPITNPLSDVLVQRTSCRSFTKKIDTQTLSTLLYYSIGEKNKTYNDGVGKRMYPSAGARFPLEFYVIIMHKVDDIPTGVYHYDVNSHRLTSLITMTKDELIAAKISTYEFVNSASLCIICTSILSRSTIKYSERAYRFGLIEAGATCQNFSLLATSLNIGSIIIGGILDDVCENLLDIDGFDESVVYGMFFG